MSQISRQRIRLELDCLVGSLLIDKLTGETPQLWRGNDLQVEFLVTYRGLIEDISNFSIIKLELKPLNDRGALSVMSDTVAAADFNLLVTQAGWDQDIEQHALIDFTNVQTNLDISGGTDRNQKDFWMVISALTTDVPAHEITLKAGLFRVVEDGTGSAAAAPVPAPPVSYTQAEADARFGSNVVKVVNDAGLSVTLVSGDGTVGIQLSCGKDEAGNAVLVTQKIVL